MHIEIVKDKLREDPDNVENIYKNIMTPISGYYLCDYYLCDEPQKWKMPEPNGLNLREHFSEILPYDILFIQSNYLQEFVSTYLPNIHVKIILVTGQTHLPQLKISSTTNSLLEHECILAWFSQNPIYSHEKYFGLPYGINNGVSHDNNPSYNNIRHYSRSLLRDNVDKTENIIHLPMRVTHPCRNIFPTLRPISVEKYYESIITSKYVLSPIGDREDCYRHWEAIGLGTIPICNIDDKHKEMFGDNMHYIQCDEMMEKYNKQPDMGYKCPNRDLVCLSYWKEKMMDVIKRDIFSQNAIIEKKIHMTWKNKDILDLNYNIVEHGVRKMRDLNPDYTFELSNDNDVDTYLKQHLENEDYNRISSRHIVEQSDLWRLLKMYNEGGVYMDLDRLCNVSLNDIIDDNFCCILPTYLDHDFSQDVMITCKGSKIIKRAIELNLQRRKNGENSIVFLGPDTYLHSITEFFYGKQLPRGRSHSEIKLLRDRIKRNFPFLGTIREVPPYSTIMYQNGPCIKFDKQEFYAHQNVHGHPS